METQTIGHQKIKIADINPKNPNQRQTLEQKQIGIKKIKRIEKQKRHRTDRTWNERPEAALKLGYDSSWDFRENREIERGVQGAAIERDRKRKFLLVRFIYLFWF